MNRWDRREKYKANYRKEADGRWTYIGMWFLPRDLPEKEKYYKGLYLAEILVNLVLCIAIGFTPSGSMIPSHAPSFNYVMMLFGILALAEVFMLVNVIPILRSGFVLTEYDSRLYPRTSGIGQIVMLCSAGMLVGQVVFMILTEHPEDLAGNIVLLVILIILAFMNGYFAYAVKRMIWEKKNNGELKR